MPGSGQHMRQQPPASLPGGHLPALIRKRGMQQAHCRLRPSPLAVRPSRAWMTACTSRCTPSDVAVTVASE
jgi:hypothetical protein